MGEAPLYGIAKLLSEKFLKYFQISGINRAENCYTVQGGHSDGRTYKAHL